MIMISPLDMFLCMFGAVLTGIPIPNVIMTPKLSPMNILSLAFVGAGVCPVTGIPTPCVPAIIVWNVPSAVLMIQGMPAIAIGRSFAICARGGIIMALPTGKPPFMILG